MKKTRSVIFGSVYNPFIIRYWLENFKLWQDKVDAVYICHDRSHTPQVEDYLDKEIKKFPKIKIFKDFGGWPTNMEKAIRATNEDLILVIHDDTYIYNPEILDEYFGLAEQGKVVTPLFVHYAPVDVVEKAVKHKYPFMLWQTKNYASCSFLLYFLFCSRENYLKTDIDFSYNLWEKGDYIKELDYTAEERFGGDTGLGFGFQLLANNIEVMPIEANNLVNVPHQKDPIAEFQKMVDSSLAWLHLQNISNTIPLWFYSPDVWFYHPEIIKQGKHKIEELKEVRNISVIVEGITMRLAWLEEFLAVDDYYEIKDLYDYYLDEKEYIIDYFKIERERIGKYREVIKELTKPSTER